MKGEGLEKFQKEVTKNPDRNGVHTFKQNSKMWKEIKPSMSKVAGYYNEDPSAFELMDIVGINNARYTQWVEGRLFVEVGDRYKTVNSLGSVERKKRCEIEPLLEIPYKDYLQLILKNIEN